MKSVWYLGNLKKILYISAFTLIELLVGVCLLLSMTAIGLRSYGYFVSEAKLSEARIFIESKIIISDINAVSGKSLAADFYGQDGSLSLQISRYYLYFPIGKEGAERNYVYYGELQKGIKTLVKDKVTGLSRIIHKPNGENEYYGIAYFDKHRLPYPTIIPEILYKKIDESSGKIISHGVLEGSGGLYIFFDPPFSNVSFALDDGSNPVDVKVKDQKKDKIKSYKVDVAELDNGDYAKEMYLDLSNVEYFKGEVELIVQYKDRKYSKSEKGERYLLRELVKYTSKNELSHFWD